MKIVLLSADIEGKTAQEIKEYLNERAQEVFNTKAAQTKWSRATVGI